MKTKFIVNFSKLHWELSSSLISGFKLIFNFRDWLKLDEENVQVIYDCDEYEHYWLNDKIITSLTLIEFLSKNKPILTDSELKNLIELAYYDYSLANQILRNCNIYKSFYLVSIPSMKNISMYCYIFKNFIDVMNRLIWQ